MKVIATASAWAGTSVAIVGGLGAPDQSLLALPASIQLIGASEPFPGTQVQAVVSGFSGVAAGIGYQWYGCLAGHCPATVGGSGWTKLPNGTLSTYSLPAKYAGGGIYVLATAAKLHFATRVLDSEIIHVAHATDVVVASGPQIYGEGSGVQAGAQVTGVRMSWAAHPMPSDYVQTDAWQVCDAELTPGCDAETDWTTEGTGSSLTTTSPHYTVGAADYGSGDSYLRLVETLTSSKFASITRASASVSIILGTLPAIAVSISHGNSTGVSCTAAPQASTYSGTAAVTWYSGTDVIGTGLTYSGDNPDPTLPLYAEADWTPAGFHPETQGAFLRSGVGGAADRGADRQRGRVRRHLLGEGADLRRRARSIAVEHSTLVQVDHRAADRDDGDVLLPRSRRSARSSRSRCRTAVRSMRLSAEPMLLGRVRPRTTSRSARSP